MSEFHDQITSLLKNSADREGPLKKILGLVLAHFKSETGTIHLLDSEKQLLHLAAESGLPPAMLAMVKTIPIGKGIAGQVIARGGPVTICNLQTDNSGVSRPDAKQSGVGGALCVPVRNGEKIVGTIGVGTIRPYEYTPEETHALEEIGRLIGAQFA
jgi:putative methionine-R-sulfoxide reductase with GAF domain